MEITKETITDALLPIEKLNELDEYIQSLSDKEGMLIHILHRAQHIFGYLPRNFSSILQGP